jgi:SAM-dependent methyltransferase
MDISNEEYFAYLKTRSKISNLYRNFLMYPVINNALNGKVLDVGCGIGDFLAFRKKDTIGIDINNLNVNYCQSLGYETYLIEDNKFPFENEVFDSVILDNVLEHLVNPEITINEISRVLKPKGKFVIGVPGKKGYTMDNDHKKFYDEIEMNKLLTQFNYTNIGFKYMPFLVKSDFLSKSISQYVIYGIYQKS